MTEQIREQLTQLVAEAEALALRAQWVAGQGVPVDLPLACRALMACDAARDAIRATTEALARAGAVPADSETFPCHGCRARKGGRFLRDAALGDLFWCWGCRG